MNSIPCSVSEWGLLPQRILRKARNSTIGPSMSFSTPIFKQSLFEYFSFLYYQHSGIRQCRECCFPLFLSWSRSEKVKASLVCFWHINSSQCKEREYQWFQNSKTDRLFWWAKLQSAPGWNERHFLETFYSPIQFWERDSSQRKLSQPSTNWLVSVAIWARGQTEIPCPHSLPGTGKASTSLDPSTWAEQAIRSYCTICKSLFSPTPSCVSTKPL